jgi:poly-gamma-glutamate capsule biosynthesis protein CapA/YwtB (metallophosphatase superfamily)
VAEWLLSAWSLAACALLLIVPAAGRGAAGPATGASPSPEITLVLVGDVMLGRGVAQALDGDWEAAFAEVQGALASADVALANLESPLTGHPYSGAGPDLRADPAAARALRTGGFDAVSLANNHALDAGVAGFEETISVLAQAGITALEPDFVGRLVWNDPAVWVLAFDDSRAPLGLEQAVQAVAAAARQVDVVVVSIHWGGEYQAAPSGRQRAVAEALAAAGADLIVGHGPHALQTLSWVGDTLVAYSLGNFLFDQPYPRDCRWGAVLRVTLRRGGLTGFDILPTVAEGGRVYPAGPEDAMAIGARLGLTPSRPVAVTTDPDDAR